MEFRRQSRKRENAIRILFAFLIFCLSSASSQGAADLEGYVYSGATGVEPPTSTPLANVTITLYGSNDVNSIGTDVIDISTTDPSGYYSVFAEGAYDYFNIVETNLSGYHSNGAASVGGTVKSADWIQYNYGELSGETVGNKFWDGPNNTAPIADAGGPYTGTVGESIKLDGSGSYDPDAGDSIVSYEWDLDDDGQYDDATGVTPSYTWNTAGVKTIHLLVTDTFGESGTDDGTVTVEEIQYDFGDAPDANYKTLLASDGARHKIDWGVYLGVSIDAETDGQPGWGGYGDDNNLPDDEDGIQFDTKLTPGSMAHISVTASVNGLFFGWIDFNNDKDFNDAGEQIYNGLSIPKGQQSQTFAVPENAVPGATFARFRFTLKTTTGPDGLAESGEVEDYPVQIEVPPYGTINGLVWDDSDHDGIDSGEADVDNVIVDLWDANNGALVNSMMTGTQGFGYQFTHIDYGDYYIEFELPTGYKFSPANQGSDDAIDSDADPVTGRTATFHLSPGQTINDIDAGMYREDPPGEYDYGDAPDPNYPTLFASNGARHLVSPGQCLGSLVDAETDGQPTTNAFGDDAAPGDDEDGIIFISPLSVGQTAKLLVTVNTVTNDYFKILGWIDFNGDGDWNDTGERIIDYVSTPQGMPPFQQMFTYQVPPGAKVGDTFARFRINFGDTLLATPDGLGDIGEVEDYMIRIADGNQAVTYNELDICRMIQLDIDGVGIADVEMSGTMVQKVYFEGNEGDADDDDHNGMDEVNTEIVGFDLNGNDPLFGVVNLTLHQGKPQLGQIEETAQNVLGRLEIAPYVSAPYPGNDHFNLYLKVELPEMGLCFYSDNAILFSAVVNSIPPASADVYVANISLAEPLHKFSCTGGPYQVPNPPPPPDGSILKIALCAAEPSVDFGDAPSPYPTLLADNGARHQINNSFFLGQGIDGETDGQPDAAAQGDDANGSDDEDGVTFKTALIPGQQATIDVDFTQATIAGLLTGWIDFNADGDWQDAGEKVFDGELLNQGVVNSLQFAVPAQATPGNTFARFRLCAIDPCPFPIGESGAGEVEDYRVQIQAAGNLDFGDAPNPYPSASHLLGGPWLGDATDKPDADPGMQRHPNALGDDNDGNDDEDGLDVFNGYLFKNVSSTIHHQYFLDANGEATVAAWIDLNQDGDWDDAGEKILDFYNPKSTPYSQSGISFYVDLPKSAKLGKTILRFRIVAGMSLNQSPGGAGGPGEVADYKVVIKQSGDGLPRGGIIQGLKWDDANGNGIMDANESPIPGWTIWLDTNGSGGYDAGDQTAVTDASGKYMFTGLTAGTYTVGEQQQPGWIQTFPNGGTHSVKIDSNQTVFIDHSFGNRQDPDAQFDYGDAPNPYPSASHLLGGAWLGDASDKPDADPGMQRHPNALGDDNDGNDDENCLNLAYINIVKGKTSCIDFYLNFGKVRKGSIAAWLDFNHDGDWDDANEDLMQGSGWTATGGVGSHKGSYNFVGTWITPVSALSGKTFLRMRILEGYDSTFSASGAGGPGEVEDYEVEIKADGDGLPKGGIIHGIKWDDANGNGVMDANEAPIPGWTIWLDTNGSGGYDAGDKTAVTDASGKYMFTGLTAGTYIVGEQQQPGWIQTFPNGGTHSVKIDSNQTVFRDHSFGNRRDEDAQFDYGDAPNPYPSASHLLGGPWLGDALGKPDADPGMQRHPNALGDDNDGNDDENCLNLAYVTIIKGKASRMGFDINLGQAQAWSVGAWLDFNHDGDWDDANEDLMQGSGWSVIGGGGSPQGSLSLVGTWITPGSALSGKTFLRLRVQEGYDSTFSASGAGGPGEVEDYEVEIKADGDGLPQGGLIHGIKWDDANGNGMMDANEPRLPGWTIWLDANHNGLRDAGDPTAVTDAQGKYMFTGLAAGAYIVDEVQQSGWIQTFPAGGAHPVKIIPNQAIFTDYSFGNRSAAGGGAPIKWSQPPLRLYDSASYWSRNFTGWGEQTTRPEVMLADDWYCRDPRPVTSITWWGSYEDWRQPTPPDVVPIAIEFGIWSDAPAGADGDFSHPEELQWSWATDFGAADEQLAGSSFWPEYMDEPESTFVYHVDIPKENWFYQQGDSTVYWLSIAAIYDQPVNEFVWGWHTREHFFNDDAVEMWDVDNFDPGAPFPGGEQLYDGFDLAFELGTDVYKWEFDFGDAPEPDYRVRSEKNGPMHFYDPDVRLGALIDKELNGQPSEDALGDDRNNLDDDDGVEFLTLLIPGEDASIKVVASVPGFLDAWIDFYVDGAGRFVYPEQILEGEELDAGVNQIGFYIPEDAQPGQTFARFRFSTVRIPVSTGLAFDGEVEDYLVKIQTPDNVTADVKLPTEFALLQNYPNPFNPSTAIDYSVPKTAGVTIEVYDLSGRKVRTLVNARHAPGRYTAVWDGHDSRGQQLSSGVYLYRMEADGFVETQKLLLVK